MVVVMVVVGGSVGWGVVGVGVLRVVMVLVLLAVVVVVAVPCFSRGVWSPFSGPLSQDKLRCFIVINIRIRKNSERGFVFIFLEPFFLFSPRVLLFMSPVIDESVFLTAGRSRR